MISTVKNDKYFTTETRISLFVKTNGHPIEEKIIMNDMIID